MWAYSQDLRQKIVQACDRKAGSQKEIARLFGVSLSFLEKLLRRRRTSGDVRSLPHRSGHRRMLREGDQETVRRLVEEQPDTTLEELREALSKERGVRVSVSTMGVELRRLGLGVKKSHSTRQRETRPGLRKPGSSTGRAS